MTSTFVERAFSALTRFSKPPQSAATLAAKHTNATFGQIVEQWRASQGICAHENARARPPWMRPSVRGARLQGYHVFAQEMRGVFKGQGVHDARAALGKQWRDLPEEAKSTYRRHAESLRRLARCSGSPLDAVLKVTDERVEGPCGVASREGPFPIRPHALAEHLSGPGSLRRAASDWRQAPMKQCA